MASCSQMCTQFPYAHLWQITYSTLQTVIIFWSQSVWREGHSPNDLGGPPAVPGKLGGNGIANHPSTNDDGILRSKDFLDEMVQTKKCTTHKLYFKWFQTQSLPKVTRVGFGSVKRAILRHGHSSWPPSQTVWIPNDPGFVRCNWKPSAFARYTVNR